MLFIILTLISKIINITSWRYELFKYEFSYNYFKLFWLIIFSSWGAFFQITSRLENNRSQLLFVVVESSAILFLFLFSTWPFIRISAYECTHLFFSLLPPFPFLFILLGMILFWFKWISEVTYIPILMFKNLIIKLVLLCFDAYFSVAYLLSFFC